MLDMGLQAVVLLLQLFQLLREHAIFTLLCAVSHNAVRAEERVIREQSGNHCGEHGGDAPPLPIRSRGDGETPRQPAWLRVGLRLRGHRIHSVSFSYCKTQFLAASVSFALSC